MADTIPPALSPQDSYAQAVRFFGRHLVCLTIDYIGLDQNGKRVGDERLYGISGFVMSFGGEWFLVTAGHALKDIDDKIATGRMELLGAAIQDHFGPDAKSLLPTMFEYASAHKCYIDRRDLGLDVGLIHLREFFRSSLELNRIVPVTESNWLKQPCDMSDYMLFGIPQERTGPTNSRPGPTGEFLSADVTPMLLPVKRTDTPHRELPPSPYPWFIGTVDTAPFGLKSIVGMSGGPIFGIRIEPNGQVLYWVVAVQSWWDPATRTIYGCPVPVFAGLVADALDSAADADTMRVVEPNAEKPCD